MTPSSGGLWEHAPVLYAVARRRCADDAEADDLVQETFVRALRGWCGYREQGNLRGWLVAILTRLHLDRVRRAASAPPHDDIDALDLPTPEPNEAPAWANLPIDQVFATLASVPPDLRATFELHAQGRSYDEIACELRIAKNTVGTRLVRTRRRIKRLLLASVPGRSERVDVLRS